MQLSPISLSLTRLGGSWDESALWPQGASSPGLWIDPSYSASEFQDSAGTTALSTVGTVLDSSNPVGLILDRKGGLVLGAELVPTSYAGPVSGSWLIGASEVTRNGSASGQASFNLSSSLSTSKTYLVSFSVANLSGDTFGFRLGALGTAYNVTSNGVYTARIAAGGEAPLLTFFTWVGGAGQATITSISVREIPGLHLSQSTSAARPVASARVNLLTYSEYFSNAAWAKSGTATTPSANTINTPAFNDYIYQLLPSLSGKTVTIFYELSGTGTICIGTYDGASSFQTSLITLTATPTIYSKTVTIGVSGDVRIIVGRFSPATATTFTVGKAQANYGPTALPYQRVGAASDYTATGFPQYLKFDGVDDALSSATFSAGTLTSSMDCLIAVRRDSADNAVCGIYNAPADGVNYVAIAASGSGAGSIGPSYSSAFVDGVQLTGGNLVIRDTMHVALSVGSWHILEVRGIDLSAWTAVYFGLRTGYVLNGALGEIQLFANGQDANRDKARARMAAYFGVTLP